MIFEEVADSAAVVDPGADERIGSGLADEALVADLHRAGPAPERHALVDDLHRAGAAAKAGARVARRLGGADRRLLDDREIRLTARDEQDCQGEEFHGGLTGIGSGRVLPTGRAGRAAAGCPPTRGGSSRSGA